MADGSVNGLGLFDKRDDSHLATTCRTKQRVNLIDFSDHLGPASGREMILPFNDQRMEGRDSGLAYLASVGIRITEAYLSDTVLPGIRKLRASLSC